MNRLIIVAGILYLSTSYSLKIRSFDEVGECHYWNDPHLKPFPKAAGENGEQFLCRPNCTEVLLRNEFVEIFVTSNQNGREYPIVEYTVIFFPTDDHPVPCVIRDSIANQSPVSSLKCPLNSPATSIGTYIHESDNVRVEIGYRGDWFNFYITQSFELIGKSSGVCVNSKCDLEGSGRRRRQAQDKEPNRLISQIIDIYTKAARRHVDGKIDDHLLESQRIAIVYDLNTSLNPRVRQNLYTVI
ncbi:hypothetical protein I4U23_001771 [Adineta vaga]|nr:hypothetical protein I4U23_001771 [Adineta vaga]